MAMSQSNLAGNLEDLEPSATEAAAIDTLVSAYSDYAADAIGNGVPITPAGLALGEAAMATALAGMSVDGAGITKIPAACLAFWTAVCSSFAVSFPTSIAATPPPHASLAAAFAALMPVNMAAGVTLSEAAASIAAIMHTDAITGGTVTLPGPIVGPIL